MTTNDERGVWAANARFYQAFRKHDLPAMRELWADQAEVSCLHPGWPLLLGRDAVLESWSTILMGGGAPPHIECTDPVIWVRGEVACVLCTERLGEGALAATNLFVREGSAWKVLHHHAGPTPPPTPVAVPGPAGSGERMH